MTTITIENAQKELAGLMDRARAGEEIVITDGKGPGVKLTVATEAQPNSTSFRGRGILKGKIRVSDEDLFAPLPDDELGRWNGESDER